MIAAIAPLGFENVLLEELERFSPEAHGRLFFCESDNIPVWAQNVWLDVKTFHFNSISEAVKHLRSIQRNWWLHSASHHRRAKLIQEQLPPIKQKELKFPSELPKAPLGSFTLLDQNKMAYSPRCTSPFPDGEVLFKENKIDPPSRAYLKLWELFTLCENRPHPGDRVIDMGSSPGGWTWVLDQLGCEVLSVDKAPLSVTLKLSNRVHFLQESAFGMMPTPADWFFSDMICYPERLLELVKRWREAGVVQNFVCTLKFQGATDHAIVGEFLRIPGSAVRHLQANKHELTWFLLSRDGNTA